jgi:hypothetical protein
MYPKLDFYHELSQITHAAGKLADLPGEQDVNQQVTSTASDEESPGRR